MNVRFSEVYFINPQIMHHLNGAELFTCTISLEYIQVCYDRYFIMFYDHDDDTDCHNVRYPLQSTGNHLHKIENGRVDISTNWFESTRVK